MNDPQSVKLSRESTHNGDPMLKDFLQEVQSVSQFELEIFAGQLLIKGRMGCLASGRGRESGAASSG